MISDELKRQLLDLSPAEADEVRALLARLATEKAVLRAESALQIKRGLRLTVPSSGSGDLEELRREGWR